MRAVFVIIGFLTVTGVATGQSGENPFDILDRLDSIYVDKPTSKANVFDVVRQEDQQQEAEISAEQSSKSTADATAPAVIETIPSADEQILGSNPFEVSHIPIRKSKLKQEADAFSQQSISTDQGTKAPTSNTFIFWLSLLAGVLLAVVINIRRNTITRLAKSLLNENILKYNHREERQGLSGYYLMLYLLYFITASIFLYLVAVHYGQTTGIRTFTMCAGAIFAAYMTKHLVLKCIGLIYPVSKESSLYGFTIESFNICIGLLLLPLNLIIAFGPIGFSQVFLYVSFTLLVLLLLLRSFRGVLIATSFIQNHIFHFFLYLCAVEIVPVLVLLKALV